METQEANPTPLIARFADVRHARGSMRVLAEYGIEPRGQPIMSSPQRTPRFQLERIRGALLGTAFGAGVGALVAWLGSGFVSAQGTLPIWAATLMGALLVGSLGLLTGLGLSEPRAIRTTTEAIRAGEAEGEVAVRFDVPARQREAVSRHLRQLGALEVAPASQGAPAPGGRATMLP